MNGKQKICNDADISLKNYIECFDCNISPHRMVNQENKCGYGLEGV